MVDNNREYRMSQTGSIPVRVSILTTVLCIATSLHFTLYSDLATMALAPTSEEHGLLQLWQLVAELSEQLHNNRAATAALQQQAGALKVTGHRIFKLGIWSLTHLILSLTGNLGSSGP